MIILDKPCSTVSKHLWIFSSCSYSPPITNLLYLESFHRRTSVTEAPLHITRLGEANLNPFGEKSFHHFESHRRRECRALFFCLFHHLMPVIKALNNRVLMYSLLTVEQLWQFTVVRWSSLSVVLMVERLRRPSLTRHFDHSRFLFFTWTLM